MENRETVSNHPAFNPDRITITKREYFAAMALQGLMVKDEVGYPLRTARYAVEMADLLIKALNE